MFFDGSVCFASRLSILCLLSFFRSGLYPCVSTVCVFLIFYLFLLDFVGLFFFSLMCPLLFSFLGTVLYLYSSILPALLAILLLFPFLVGSDFISFLFRIDLVRSLISCRFYLFASIRAVLDLSWYFYSLRSC